MRNPPKAKPESGHGEVAAAGAKRRKIFFVDDHPLTRAGFRALVDRESDLSVCGEADDGLAALKLIPRCRPDLIVIDVTLRTSNGIDLAKEVTVRWPEMPILVMSMHNEDSYAALAIRAGARGYMMKDEACEKIIPAIRELLAGQLYVSERFKGKFGLSSSKSGAGKRP